MDKERHPLRHRPRRRQHAGASAQINAQQNGTAYIWNSTTQELLPILWPDHPQYRENMDRVLAAIRRWNGEAK